MHQDAILGSLERARLYVDQASKTDLVDGDYDQAGGAWPGFMPAFLDKGRQRDLVSRIPVKLVSGPRSRSRSAVDAYHGCAHALVHPCTDTH